MKNILKNLALLILFAVGNSAIAQQTYTLTSMYNQSLYNINPAIVGYSGCFEANIQHKNQWSKLAGRPTNYLLQGQVGLGENSGLGINLNSWKAGLLQNNKLGISYAYHLPIGNQSKLSLGLTANIMNQNISSSSAIVFDNGDGILNSGDLSTTGVNFDAGLLFSTSKLKIGFASPQLISSAMRYSGVVVSNGFNSERMYNAHASYDIKLSDKLFYTPTLVFRTIPNSSSIVDINNRIGFNDLVGFGLGYRTNNSLFGSIDLKIDDKLKFAYVFDVFSGNNTIGGLSHEILLGVNFCKNKAVETKEYSVSIYDENGKMKTHYFKTLENMQQFIKEESNPIVQDKFKEAMDENPDLKFVEINLGEEHELDVEINGIYLKVKRFRNVKEMEDYLDELEKTQPEIVKNFRQQIKENPDKEIYTIDLTEK